MYFSELVPRDDYTSFIPDFLLDDELPTGIFASLAPFLAKQGMSIRDYVGFVSGAEDLQKIVHGEKDDESYATWFKTDKVEDVRVFFRTSDKDRDRALGSKMRLYSVGTPYGGGDPETQHLDSGFLNFNMMSGPAMVYQKALASTMLYRSLYCIGGPATVRKVNVPAGKDDRAPSYRWISAIRPSYTEDVDRHSYTHLLHGAVREAGLEDDFFDNRFLDAFLRVLFNSTTMDEMRRGLENLPEEFSSEEVSEIIEVSNRPDANLSNASKTDFDKAEGLNVVRTLSKMAEILD